MSEIKIHWSFWVICILGLIWNLMGCINFIMQMNPQMLSNYPEEARSLVASRPLWSTGAFAIAVFGGAIGDIVLILRKAIALHMFIVSLLGAIVTNIHTIQVTGDTNIWIGSVMSIVIAGFFIWYTKLTKYKGWLS